MRDYWAGRGGKGGRALGVPPHRKNLKFYILEDYIMFAITLSYDVLRLEGNKL